MGSIFYLVGVCYDLTFLRGFADLLLHKQVFLLHLMENNLVPLVPEAVPSSIYQFYPILTSLIAVEIDSTPMESHSHARRFKIKAILTTE